MSEWQMRVLSFLRTIPKGRVVTYGQIAAHLGDPRKARAVGGALHRNPSAAHYPCYKVVDRRGNLAERYAFGGREEQRRRLEQEGIEVSGWRVDLARYDWSPN